MVNYDLHISTLTTFHNPCMLLLLPTIITIHSRSVFKRTIMKSIIKITAIAAVFAGVVALSSCHRQTCPTYTKSNNEVPAQVRA